MELDGKVALVTGASGAGKSSVRTAIEGELSPVVECVELRDVVAIPAAPTLAWRQRSTEAVVRRALDLQRSGRRLPGLSSSWSTQLIDTSLMTRAAVADAVLAWCRSVLAGQAPVLRIA